MMIHIVTNKDRVASLVVGFAQLADGLIRTVSLGFLAGSFGSQATLWCLRRQAGKNR